MHANEIRNAFESFFVERGHTNEKSSPVVPLGDPTLLFTNAGMNQFKNVFIGAEKRPYSRATTCQKCIRAGGKHNDLENVGKTPRHHTFFEMLGNFSFGDYFKEDAIAFAWELITNVYDLPAKYLWISVFEEDDEAEKLWKKFVPQSQIIRLGKKDNFWEMGDTGPCGPCSEINIDLRPLFGSADSIAAFDDDMCLELWNLVFMQYNRQEDGSVQPLPRPSVDTGAGLERLSSVLQNAHSNYETDLFTPLIEKVASLSGVKYTPLECYGNTPMTEKDIDAGMPHRVIADHIRALAFAIADGAVPSNEGRGYVLRRILRRAARYGRRIECEKPFLTELLDPLIHVMGDTYPQLNERKDHIASLICEEEERFSSTLSDGISRFVSLVKSLPDKTKEISGEDAFKLYDTYGFPLDITRDMAEERGLSVDEDGFNSELEKQRERAKAAQSGVSQVVEKVYEDVYVACGDSTFTGYTSLETDTLVSALITEKGDIVNTLSAEESGVMIVDATPFYGTSGGQEGDFGIWHSSQGKGRIVRATRPVNQMVAHEIIIDEGTLSKGDIITLAVDADNRTATMRHHTATHLFHAALHAVIGTHATQAGSSVNGDRLRFDFHHTSALTIEEKQAIEEHVNALILKDIPVEVEETTLEDAKRSGAMMLFDEKYGDTVRMVRIGEYSCELCGGTHASHTGIIGMFLLVDESSVAAGIRRVEAVCGYAAYEYVRAERAALHSAAAELNCAAQDIPEKIQGLQKENKKLVKKLKNARSVDSAGVAQELKESAKDYNGATLIVGNAGECDAGQLLGIADQLRAGLSSYIIVLGAHTEEKCFFVAQASDDQVAAGIHAGNIVKEIAKITGGGGGGKPNSAQAGGKNPGKLDDALAAVEPLLNT